MEPLFFKAENELLQCLNLKKYSASMEPLFFKAENNYDSQEVAWCYDGLQWSRFFSKRKM